MSWFLGGRALLVWRWRPRSMVDWSIKTLFDHSTCGPSSLVDLVVVGWVDFNRLVERHGSWRVCVCVYWRKIPPSLALLFSHSRLWITAQSFPLQCPTERNDFLDPFDSIIYSSSSFPYSSSCSSHFLVALASLLIDRFRFFRFFFLPEYFIWFPPVCLNWHCRRRAWQIFGLFEMSNHDKVDL